MRLLSLALAVGAAGLAPAQTNTVPGLDGRLTNIASPTYFGRRGPTHPGGEIAMSYSYTMCNSGTVLIPWLSPNAGPSPMQRDHPKFAYMVARESGGRMVQITDEGTFAKHAFGAANSSSTCGTCQNPGSSTVIGINCADTYGASTNANRYWLGPTAEIDPWTGIWDPVGSYFDRGDPDVGFPQNQDGVRSLTSGSFADAVKNRVTLREGDLLAGGRYYYCMHMVVEAEDADNHFDNLGHREMTPSWNGSTWSFANTGAGFTQGSVLHAWQGAGVTGARNGEDDGHFLVAVVVTGPVGGLFHYEYAVHNLDNLRGGASLRIPVCPSTVVANAGFRDIDGNPLNEWTWSRIGDELAFQATASNPLNWNSMFNFWFDCATAPVAGSVAIDQARLGPGALAVTVATQVPGGSARVIALGAGCGAPPPVLTANGLPTIPNPAFGLTITAAPNTGLLLFYSLGSANLPLGNGCVQYLDQTTLGTHGFLMADGSGLALATAPIPGSLALEGLPVSWQAAELVSGGPLFAAFALSNGVQTLVGCR